jgi:hypothetical protein
MRTAADQLVRDELDRGENIRTLSPKPVPSPEDNPSRAIRDASGTTIGRLTARRIG